MPIPVNLIQQNRKGGNNLFYGYTTYYGTKTTDEIAKTIMDSCSAKVSDCQAIISEFHSVLDRLLRDSMKVKLDGLGTFWLGIKSSGAITRDEYRPTENIKGIRVNFSPMLKRQSDGQFRSPITEGVRFEISSGDKKAREIFSKLAADKRPAKGWNEYMGRIKK